VRLFQKLIIPAMATILGLALAFPLLLAVLDATPVQADDGSVDFESGSVLPVANSGIRMEAETVQAVCYWGFAEYRVDFKFVNEGDNQRVLLGFPFVSSQIDGGTALVAFQAAQDDRPLDVTVGQGEDPLHPGSMLDYYLHEAVFPHGESMITVSYLQTPKTNSGTRFGPDAPAIVGPWGHPALYGYWLHTGAPWSDSIGKAVIQYRLADDFVGWAVDAKAADLGESPDSDNITRPESYVEIDDRTYRWVFQDLEPTPADDIALAYTEPPTYGGGGLAAFTLTSVKDCTASARLDDSATLPPGWEAFDGSPQNAWGIPAPGAGGWLKAIIPGSMDLEEIRILPGNNKTPDSFSEYGRPRTVRVTLSDGTSTVVTLADSPSLQKLSLTGKAEWVRFDILDIYPGTTSNDTYISEIDLGTEPTPPFARFAELVAVPAPRGTTSASASSSSYGLPPTTTSADSGATVATSPLTPTTIESSGQDAASPATSPALEQQRPLWPFIVALVIGALGLVVLSYVAVEARTRRSGSDLSE
jgi:hypothetical protein